MWGLQKASELGKNAAIVSYGIEKAKLIADEAMNPPRQPGETFFTEISQPTASVNGVIFRVSHSFAKA